MSVIAKARGFLEDVRTEMSRVTWPTRDSLKESTIIVIVISLMFAAFSFAGDRLLSELVTLLYTYFAGN